MGPSLGPAAKGGAALGSAAKLLAMPRRVLALAVSLLSLLPADALARAGGGSHSFGGGGGSRGSGRGFGGGGGHHFFFFGGGGGGGGFFLLLIIIALIVAFMIFRSRRQPRT